VVYLQGLHQRILPTQVNLSKFLTFAAYSEITLPKLKGLHTIKHSTKIVLLAAFVGTMFLGELA